MAPKNASSVILKIAREAGAARNLPGSLIFTGDSLGVTQRREAIHPAYFFLIRIFNEP